MKSAETLYNIWCGSSYSWDAVSSLEKMRWQRLLDAINKSERGAIKEGITLAAEIAVTAKVHKAHDKVNYDDWVSSDGGLIKQAILAARDNLKELV